MKIYLVGGAVRDQLLGRKNKDRDYVVIGGDEAALRQHLPGVKCVGRRHQVYLHRGAEYTLSAAPTIEADLLGRDLTINALAKRPDGRLVGAPNALDDLRGGVLRPVALENFFHDPLRVVRAARFSALFPDFRLDASLQKAMQRVGVSGRLADVSAERVGNEVQAAMAAPRPANFLRLLADTKALEPWFEEWCLADAIPAGPPAYHEGSVLDHTLVVMDRLAGNPLAVWMGFCHDMGKTATDPDKLPSHHGHEISGEHLARALGERLRLPNRFISAGAAAARWHMTVGRYAQLRSATKVDLLLCLRRLKRVPEMVALAAADKPGLDVSQMSVDLETLLAVRLPAEAMGQGARTGELLRQRRCQALGGRS